MRRRGAGRRDYWAGQNLAERNLGAQKRTRTSTVLRPLGPEPSASTNSAIWAGATATHYFRRLFRSLSKRKPTDTQTGARAPTRRRSFARRHRHRADRSGRSARSRRARRGDSDVDRARSRRARRLHRSARAQSRRAPASIARASSASPPSSTCIAGTRAGPSRRIRLPGSRRRRRRPLPRPARDAQGAARRSRDGARHRRRSARPPRGRDRRRARARQPRGRRAAARGARHLVRRRREPADQPGPAGARRAIAAARKPARSSSSRSSSSRPSTARPIARVKEVLGHATDPGIEIEIALRKHDLPFEFSQAALASGEAAADRGPAGRSQGPRRPHRRCRSSRSTARRRRTSTTPSIASARARASASSSRSPTSRITCATATRSTRDARERGTSVYFPRRVIPMLPEELSNELCSLKPRRRPAVHGRATWIVRAGRDRGVRVLSGGHAFARAAHVHAGVVVAVRSRERGDARRARRCCRTCSDLYALFKILLAARERARRHRLRHRRARSSSSTSRARSRAIVPAPRNDAHKLIEECMLAANVCAARLPRRARAARRCTACTRARRRRSSRRCASSSPAARCRWPAATSRPPPTTRSCSTRIRERPDFALLQTVLLRSLSQAQYRPDNVGHFGLAYDAYAHFTSPIRRYPDLLVHRAIKAVLAGKRYTPAAQSWDAARRALLDDRAPRRRRDARRRATGSSATTCRTRSARTFDGTISGVASFGIFVTLDGLNIDGLVHVTELGRDYFHFDAGAACADRRAQRPRVPARGPAARQGRARRPRDTPRSTSRWPRTAAIVPRRTPTRSRRPDGRDA